VKVGFSSTDLRHVEIITALASIFPDELNVRQCRLLKHCFPAFDKILDSTLKQGALLDTTKAALVLSAAIADMPSSGCNSSNNKDIFKSHEENQADVMNDMGKQVQLMNYHRIGEMALLFTAICSSHSCFLDSITQSAGAKSSEGVLASLLSTQTAHENLHEQFPPWSLGKRKNVDGQIPTPLSKQTIQGITPRNPITHSEYQRENTNKKNKKNGESEDEGKENRLHSPIRGRGKVLSFANTPLTTPPSNCM
jgi:hypothetical protein